MTSDLSPIVDTKKLAKSYPMGHGTVHALREIDFTVLRGESVAIMGPSGSGKSTLMHLLGCLDTPTAGQYFLDQQDVSHLSDKDLAYIRSSKIGFIFQSFNLIPQLTVYENVEIPFFYQTSLQQDIKEKIVESLERVGLAHRLNHRPCELSGGEMQRVAIARALAVGPLLVLADEPTGNLDSETGKSILKLFKTLNEQGVTLVIVTHDKSVGNHCQRIVEMKDGRVVPCS